MASRQNTENKYQRQESMDGASCRNCGAGLFLAGTPGHGDDAGDVPAWRPSLQKGHSGSTSSS